MTLSFHVIYNALKDGDAEGKENYQHWIVRVELMYMALTTAIALIGKDRNEEAEHAALAIKVRWIE